MGRGALQGELISFERRAARLRSPGPLGSGDEGWVSRVLVIGGAGYIGSVLCRRLLSEGYSVRVLDALFYGEDSLRELLDDRRFELQRGDSRDVAAVTMAMRDVRAIVHLGEIVGDPACSLDERTTREINFAATQMVAEVAKSEGIGRFSYASSCSVYGASKDVLTETSPLNPLSIYAQAKIDAEQALRGLSGRSFRPLILRLATVYGISPRPRFDLVVNALAARAIADGEITINGGGQWRPFVHVSDVARLLADCLKTSQSLVGGEVFNVGSNAQNHTIGEIGELVRQCAPAAVLKIRDGVGDLDARNYHVSFAKAESELGFQPRKSVMQGIREVQHAVATGQVGDYKAPKYHNVAMLSQSSNGHPPAYRPRYVAPMVLEAGEANASIERDRGAQLGPRAFAAEGA